MSTRRRWHAPPRPRPSILKTALRQGGVLSGLLRTSHNTSKVRLMSPQFVRKTFLTHLGKSFILSLTSQHLPCHVPRSHTATLYLTLLSAYLCFVNAVSAPACPLCHPCPPPTGVKMSGTPPACCVRAGLTTETRAGHWHILWAQHSSRCRNPLHQVGSAAHRRSAETDPDPTGNPRPAASIPAAARTLVANAPRQRDTTQS